MKMIFVLGKSTEMEMKMAKETAATRHTKAHLKRRMDRLENRKMPTFQGYVGADNCGNQVVADVDGALYRIDIGNGTIRKLRWEQ
jgi:hypothetical protein